MDTSGIAYTGRVCGLSVPHKGHRQVVEANLDSTGTNIVAAPVSAKPRRTNVFRSPFATISDVHGYVPALATFFTAVALHWILLKLFGTVFFAGVMFLYVAAIVVGGWCGYGPGVVVVLLVFSVPGFLFSPSYSIRNISPSAVGVSILLSLLISRGASSRR